MIVILRVIVAYFLVLAAASILLLPFYSTLPHTYVLGFGLLALPTMPIIKVLFPIFEGIHSTDSTMLFLIFVVSIVYAGAAYLLIALLRKSGFGDGAGRPTGSSNSS